jgi:hypothetical protein
MITFVRLRNFKCFREQTLEFSPLTLLSGLNGMGKSSVIQALLLLRQSYHQGTLPETGVTLNGELLRLGTMCPTRWWRLSTVSFAFCQHYGISPDATNMEIRRWLGPEPPPLQ